MSQSELHTTNCLGYSIFKGNLEALWQRKKIVVNTINQYSYCIAQKDEEFDKALKEGDILLPDGVGITFAAKFLEGEKVTKIAGADIHDFLLKKLNEEKGRCFYLGSSENTLAKIKERLADEYPNIKMQSYSPPYKKSFTPEDDQKMIHAVNRCSPDVLFIGMTAPKQEKWVFKNKEKLDANIICSIGAVFDFYAGTVERPNKVWIDLGLEWLGRLIKEPKRMWRRYIYYGIIYARHLIVVKLRGQKTDGDGISYGDVGI